MEQQVLECYQNCDHKKTTYDKHGKEHSFCMHPNPILGGTGNCNTQTIKGQYPRYRWEQ